MSITSKALALCLMLGASPAMAMGVPGVFGIGTATAAAGSTTLSITTTATCPAGEAIIVGVGSTASTTISSVVDSATSATYTQSTSAAGGSRGALWAGPGSTGLASGQTITITYGASTVKEYAAAICVVGGVQSLIKDANSSASFTTTTTPSLTSASLSQNGEVAVGFSMVTAGGADTFTEASGFTSLASAGDGTNIFRWAWQPAYATTAITYAPTLGTSRSGVIGLVTYKVAICARNLTLGAGC